MTSPAVCVPRSCQKTFVATISSHVVAPEQDISDEMLRQLQDYFVGGKKKPGYFKQDIGTFQAVSKTLFLT